MGKRTQTLDRGTLPRTAASNQVVETYQGLSMEKDAPKINFEPFGKAPQHHHTSSSMLHGGNHTCRDHPFTYSASHEDMAVWTKNLKFGLVKPKRTDFHQSNVHCSGFLVQASLFFLMVSFSNGFFAAIRPWRQFSSEQLMLRCVCYLNSEAFIWAAISEAGN